jgi:type 1 glutamine amidotransferase
MPPNAPQPALLLYTQTAGYRHRSIPAAIAAVRKLGLKHGFAVEASEDPGVFRADNLNRFRAVAFLNTTGNILDTQGREALEAFVKGGGGFAGIHAACDTGYDWPWYGTLVGAYFKRHPRGIHRAVVRIVDKTHASTRKSPGLWARWDEWYDYKENPRERVQVLAVLDEKTYFGGAMGADHPIVWCHERAGGRAWYTGLGHTRRSFSDPHYLRHLLGGLKYALKLDGMPELRQEA